MWIIVGLEDVIDFFLSIFAHIFMAFDDGFSFIGRAFGSVGNAVYNVFYKIKTKIRCKQQLNQYRKTEFVCNFSKTNRNTFEGISFYPPQSLLPTKKEKETMELLVGRKVVLEKYYAISKMECSNICPSTFYAEDGDPVFEIIKQVLEDLNDVYSKYRESCYNEFTASKDLFKKNKYEYCLTENNGRYILSYNYDHREQTLNDSYKNEYKIIHPDIILALWFSHNGKFYYNTDCCSDEFVLAFIDGISSGFCCNTNSFDGSNFDSLEKITMDKVCENLKQFYGDDMAVRFWEKEPKSQCNCFMPNYNIVDDYNRKLCWFVDYDRIINGGKNNIE